jgi:lysophospholipase L1-like esterase
MVIKARKLIFLFFALILISLSYLLVYTKPFYGNPARYEQLVIEAEQQSFCEGGIVFFGSSSIRGWKQTPTTRFNNANLTMVGFGGGMLNHLTHYFERIVVPRKPTALFIYAGENDVGAGIWSSSIIKELKKLLTLVDALNADTQVYFMSIKPSPKRTDELKMQSTVNGLVEKLAEQTDNLTFIDVSSTFFENGELKAELFQEDGIHLSHSGYEKWTELLAPTVNKIQTAACL